MEPSTQKRSRNFTEKDKLLLIEVVQDYVSVIDNKKTDGVSVEAKKAAWKTLTAKYNAITETGPRSEKQLHALYDDLKKMARKYLNDDKAETYKTGGGSFTPKTTVVDEKVVALLTPQFKPLINKYDSSASYYNSDKDMEIISVLDTASDEHQPLQSSSQDTVCIVPSLSLQELDVAMQDSKGIAPSLHDVMDTQTSSPALEFETPLKNTPQQKRILAEKRKPTLTENKKKAISSISSMILKRKTEKQINEDALTSKKLELFNVQIEHEKLKMEKSKQILDAELEIKLLQLENYKLDLEIKRKML